MIPSQQSFTPQTNKHPRDYENHIEDQERESFEERTERAAKKQKLEYFNTTDLNPGRVSMAPANRDSMEKLQAVAVVNPCASTSTNQKPLRDEILLFLSEELNKTVARPADQFKINSKEKIVSNIQSIYRCYSTCPIAEIFSVNSGGFYLPLILARGRNWNLLNRIVKEGHSVDFNYSAPAGLSQGETIFLEAAKADQWGLLRYILKNHKISHINAAVHTGDFKGANAIYYAAAKNQWEIVTEILTLYPHVDVNFSLGKSWGLVPPQATLILLASLEKKWDVVKLILATANDCHLDAVIPWGFHQGSNALLLAANDKEWDVFLTILRKKIPQEINTTERFGPGYTALYRACQAKRWDVVSEILDLCPKASVNIGPLIGYISGATPLLIAAENKKWDIVEKMLNLNPDANVDAAYQESFRAGRSPFWFATQDCKWPIALKMIAIKPRLYLEGPLEPKLTPLAAAIADHQIGFAKLLLILGALNPDLHTFYPIVKDGNQVMVQALHTVKELRKQLELTRSKIYETLYNQWNTPENATFSYIRTDKDLRSLIACDILLGEHPDLAVVPNLTAIVEEWLQLDGKRDQAAKERTVTLAFREFRWNNGINANLTKASIKDIKNLIDDSLSEVEKSVAISYSSAMRQRIVDSIGEPQNKTVRFNRTFIRGAINKGVAPPNMAPPQ